MGLIKAAIGSVGGVLADQWKEYFYCEALSNEILMKKGQKKTSGRSSNTRASDNIISSGSVVAVADGQCMMIVEQGKIVEFSAEPGAFVFDASTEPTIFSGDFGKSVVDVFHAMGKRFTFGGEPPKDQRVYYFNTREILGNKYGTPSSVPFRVIDQRAGIDLDIAVKCFGEYSYRLTNPILFYTNVGGNVADEYNRADMDGMLRTELLTSLQPAFAKISEMGVRYSAVPAHAKDLADILNEELSDKWRDLRGIEIVSFGVSSIKADEEDENMIKELQRAVTLSNARMAAGHLAGAQAAAMQAAANNEGAGPAMAFMGMNMAGQAGGMNAASLFQQGQSVPSVQSQYQQAASAPSSPEGTGWTCSCGHTGNTGKFCEECGKPKPASPEGWTCPQCGKMNKGKFCTECGAKKPMGVPQYRCDKCGWEPSDPAHPPKFCPQCGDPFDTGDMK